MAFQFLLGSQKLVLARQCSTRTLGVLRTLGSASGERQQSGEGRRELQARRGQAQGTDWQMPSGPHILQPGRLQSEAKDSKWHPRVTQPGGGPVKVGALELGSGPIEGFLGRRRPPNGPSSHSSLGAQRTDHGPFLRHVGSCFQPSFFWLGIYCELIICESTRTHLHAPARL